MTRLIKAEWYRLIHTGIFKYYILLCFIFPITTMMTDLNWYKMTLSENMMLFTQNTNMILPMFLSMAISISIGLAYQNKTIYYEVMDGKKTHKIILSKIILYTTIFVVGVSFTYAIYFGVTGIKNGIGEFSDIPLRLILTEIIIIRICAVTVLISMLVKHPVGLAAAILRFMFLDNLLFIIVMGSNLDSTSELSVINSKSGLDWIVSGQLTRIFSANIDSKLILAIFATLVFEIAFWYILTHISYKRKMFR